ncbi:hypothetical protein [Mycobacterium sp. 236(2023)]|uniref:hypothetical protein n=1 Tax=Mycobacterium sp. 236(2023) TaxID=3038163 RepID=UPI003242D5D6
MASRLAQGLPAVETVQRYVWACHRLGYQHQDLTLNPAQVSDWYATEDGMDLSALQQGCLALDAAVRSSQEALTIQERQLAEIPTAWRGVGGQAAHQFLRRHSDASATVAAAVQTAADALAALREELWRAVGAKVDAVVAIEGRTEGARAEWSAASATVTTGAGDQAAASELVDQAVKPFVDNTIGTEWLGAMRTATGSVTAAYERAVAEIDAEPAPVFDVPGDFGPACPPTVETDCPPSRPECDELRSVLAAPGVAPAPAPATAPAAATVPAAAWTAAPPVPAPVEPVPAPAPAPPVAPPLGAMGSALPDLGGGRSGLGQQFADTLGGLLGGAGDIGGELPEPPELDPDEPEVEEPEEELTEDELEDDDVEDDGAPAAEEPPAEAVIETGEAAPVEEAPCEPAPEPPPPPPPAEPLPPAEPVAAESTPCEVAAGEVPQVGEPEK